MDRKEFLTAIGFGAASWSVLACAGCGKGGEASANGVSGPTNVDFTLDLSASANAALSTNGGMVAVNSIIVARTTSGTYIAVQQSCTHESYPLTYQSVNQRFYCNNHGSAFGEGGAVLTGPASKALTVYNTTLTGSSLRIYS